MKRNLFIWMIFVCLSAQAQQTNIIDNLESFQTSAQGTISVKSDPAITNLIGNCMSNAGLEDLDFIKVNGYRIQIFMDNTPRTAKSEALNKRGKLNEMFPELTTYVIYEAPVWKLLAGDFLTKEEAAMYEQKIKKAFPDFGKEIYSIPYEVKIPINNNAE